MKMAGIDWNKIDIMKKWSIIFRVLFSYFIWGRIFGIYNN